MNDGLNAKALKRARNPGRIRDGEGADLRFLWNFCHQRVVGDFRHCSDDGAKLDLAGSYEISSRDFDQIPGCAYLGCELVDSNREEEGLRARCPASCIGD